MHVQKPPWTPPPGLASLSILAVLLYILLLSFLLTHGFLTKINYSLKIITKILYGLQFYKDAVTIECVSMESLEFLFFKDKDFNPTNKEFRKIFVKFECPRRFLERLIVQKINSNFNNYYVHGWH